MTRTENRRRHTDATEKARNRRAAHRAVREAQQAKPLVSRVLAFLGQGVTMNEDDRAKLIRDSFTDLEPLPTSRTRP